MFEDLSSAQLAIAGVLCVSAFGVICAKKPVHSSLFFMLSLLSLAAFYLQLSANFIALMQVLVYAGAILVLFVFVMILFQDAHEQIALHKRKTSLYLVAAAILIFVSSLGALCSKLAPLSTQKHALLSDFGEVESLGRTLYMDFFFPFEAVIVIFLIAIVGALYIGKKVK